MFLLIKLIFSGFLENGIMVVDHNRMKAHYREQLEFKLDVISMVPADYIGYIIRSKWFVVIRVLRFQRKGRLGTILNL